MIRGFAIKIIEDLHLDAEDNSLKIYWTHNKQPYLFGDKVITL